MIRLSELFDELIYACGYTLVLALWALFLFYIAGPTMCMISMLILKMVLGTFSMLINVALYFNLSSSSDLEPFKTVIFDFSEFIFPPMHSYMDFIFRK